MRKSEVETRYDRGTTRPSICVKNHLWLPDLIRQYAGPSPATPHEFSDDAGFWAWLQDRYDAQDYDALDGADEWAAEDCWEQAEAEANEIWGSGMRLLPYMHRVDHTYVGPVKVWQEGRSGGWLVVDGLPPVECWDAIELGRWSRFRKAIRLLADEEYPYQYIWQLHGIWERVQTDRQNAYPVPRQSPNPKRLKGR